MTDNSIPRNMLKLVMLGDGGVGKTALVIQLCLNKFVETYDPTIEDSYRKQLILDDRPTTLEVTDTAGQEEFESLRDMWIRDGEGFLLVYSITQRMSFARVKQYFSEIVSVKAGEPFGAILVGNKLDQASERQVSVEEGEELAKKWGIPFFETSAKMNINIESTFRILAQSTRDKCEDPENCTTSNDSNANSLDTVATSDNADQVDVDNSKYNPDISDSNTPAAKNTAESNTALDDASQLKSAPVQTSEDGQSEQIVENTTADTLDAKLNKKQSKLEKKAEKIHRKVKRKEQKKGDKHKCTIM